jgi:hypothetical protein
VQDATPEEESFFIKESLPRIIKICLNRKYDWVKTDFSRVEEVLQRLVAFAAMHLKDNHEVLLLKIAHLLFYLLGNKYAYLFYTLRCNLLRL